MSLEPKHAMELLAEKWEKEPVTDPPPADYASQIDHYLYGTPKRDSA